MSICNENHKIYDDISKQIDGRIKRDNAVVAYCMDNPSVLEFQGSFNAIEYGTLSYVVV